MSGPETPTARAVRLGISQVAVTNHDLASALMGDPIVVSTLDGQEVLLRLMTAEEFMAANRAAISRLYPDGGGPQPCSWERAVDLTTPTKLRR